jgi:hypothetical protein
VAFVIDHGLGWHGEHRLTIHYCSITHIFLFDRPPLPHPAAGDGGLFHVGYDKFGR